MRSSLTGEDYGTIPGEPVQTNMGNRFMAVCTGGYITSSWQYVQIGYITGSWQYVQVGCITIS